MQLSSSGYHRFRNMEKCAVSAELGFTVNRQDHVQGMHVKYYFVKTV